MENENEAMVKTVILRSSDYNHDVACNLLKGILQGEAESGDSIIFYTSYDTGMKIPICSAGNLNISQNILYVLY